MAHAKNSISVRGTFLLSSNVLITYHSEKKIIDARKVIGICRNFFQLQFFEPILSFRKYFGLKILLY